MRLTVLLMTLSLTGFAFSQEPEEEQIDSTNTQEDSIIFVYEILEPEAANPKIWTSGDTIKFKLYYVDVECEKYLYEFEKQKKSLIVSRITSSSDDCDRSSDLIYAVEGEIIHVPKGKFLFELESKIGDKTGSIFREVVIVK